MGRTKPTKHLKFKLIKSGNTMITGRKEKGTQKNSSYEFENLKAQYKKYKNTSYSHDSKLILKKTKSSHVKVLPIARIQPHLFTYRQIGSNMRKIIY